MFGDVILGYRASLFPTIEGGFRGCSRSNGDLSYGFPSSLLLLKSTQSCLKAPTRLSGVFFSFPSSLRCVLVVVFFDLFVFASMGTRSVDPSTLPPGRVGRRRPTRVAFAPREVEVQMNIRSFVPFTTCLGSRCQRIVITIVIVLLQINSSTYKSSLKYMFSSSLISYLVGSVEV